MSNQPRRILFPLAVSATVAAAMLALSACGGAQSRFASHMKRGQEYYTQGDYTKASIEFRNAVQIEPKDVSARLAAGRAAEKLQHMREAYSLYQAVVDQAPDNIEAHADLARLLVLSRSPDQALKTIEPTLAKSPNDVVLLTLRAAAREQLKNMVGAVEDADHALKLDPSNEEAIEVRAGLYKSVGDLPSARKLVEDAVKKATKSMTLREMLVDLDVSAQDPGQAEQQLVSLIKLAPEVTRYRYQLALLYSRGNDLDNAQRVLEQAVQDLPKSEEAKLTLVNFMSTKRTPEQGEKMLRDFVARAPNDYQLRLSLGALLARSGSTKEAIEVYTDVVRRDAEGPEGVTARNRLIDIAFAQGRDADAQKLIAEVLQKNPRDADALTRRAQMELAKGDSAAAIGDLRAVLRDHPKAVNLQQFLAQAYWANGEPALAEQSLHAALDVAPDSVPVSLDLAKLLLDTRRTDQAVELLEGTVRKAPQDGEARAMLVRAYLAKQDYASVRTAAQDLQTLVPKSDLGPYFLGVAAAGQNKLDEAQKAFEQALSLQPKAFEPLSALARLDLARGQPQQAITLVKAAADGDSSDARVLNLLGELYLGQKELDHAKDALTRATTAAPKWWVPLRNLALVELTAGDTTGAVASFQAGLKLAPTEPQLVSELASFYEGHGRAGDAIAVYDAAYRINPRAVGIANNLAMLLVTYRTDRASLDRARDLSAAFSSSDDGRLLDTNGWVHFKRGEYAQALPVLGRAVDKFPDSGQIRYHLAMAELHAGQTDRARTDLETALSRAAKFMGADEARATLASLKDHQSG
jgi:tetratricopeptide (TPR) repeat protein